MMIGSTSEWVKVETTPTGTKVSVTIVVGTHVGKATVVSYRGSITKDVRAARELAQHNLDGALAASREEDAA